MPRQLVLISAKRPAEVCVGGEIWLACPVAGVRCALVSAALGEQWVADVLARHVELHHRPWR